MTSVLVRRSCEGVGTQKEDDNHMKADKRQRLQW